MELDYVFISGYCVYGIYAADKLCFSQLSHHRGSEYADVMDWCWFAYMQNKYEMQSNDVVLPRKKYDDFSCLFEMLLLLARERHCQTWFRRTMLIENTHSDTAHIPFAIRKRNEFFSRFKSAEQTIVIFCVCAICQFNARPWELLQFAEQMKHLVAIWNAFTIFRWSSTELINSHRQSISSLGTK